MKLPKNFRPKVVIYSLIALACLFLTYFVNVWFAAGAVIFMLLNQRELMKKKP